MVAAILSRPQCVKEWDGVIIITVYVCYFPGPSQYHNKRSRADQATPVIYFNYFEAVLFIHIVHLIVIQARAGEY